MCATNYVYLQVNWLLLVSDLIQDRNISRNLVKDINIKFHENLFGGSKIVACREKYGQTGMAKQLGTFLT
jgi:hypothetical protein